MQAPDYEVFYDSDVCPAGDAHETARLMRVDRWVPETAFCLLCGRRARVVVFGVSQP